MRRSLILRITGLLLAALTGITASSLSLAHGYAHHEAHEHAVGGGSRHHGGAAAVSHHSPVDAQLALHSVGDSGDHDHLELAFGLCGRPGVPFLPAKPAASFCAGADVDSRMAMLLTVADARAGPTDATPRQPRAPPLA